MPPTISPPIYFSQFNVTSQVFHRTPLSYALVNLKPLKPGHVLICPRRVAPTFQDLNRSEIADLFETAQVVSGMIRRVYDAPAVNIAIQDGPEAGQTVPHLHIHIIPRHRGDFGGQADRVYDLLESREGYVGGALKERWSGVDDGLRRARGEDEMRTEAELLRMEMEKAPFAGSTGESGEDDGTSSTNFTS
ncbi:MAG: hypothetical protein M1816_000052 [Peltula sp. TS41687]|nr:MAG: hypothetical protein M1816_000052 [Peltula sp. TS41687]